MRSLQNDAIRQGVPCLFFLCRAEAPGFGEGLKSPDTGDRVAQALNKRKQGLTQVLNVVWLAETCHLPLQSGAWAGQRHQTPVRG